MAFFSLFKASARELKDIRCIAATGVLVAAYIVLEMFTIQTGIFKINFAFLALAAIGMLYGPVVGVLAAVPCDIIGASLQGNGLVFVFTLIAMFEGLVYGLFLYGYAAKPNLRQSAKLVAAQLIVVLISHLVFNTAALYFLGFAGQTYDSVMLFIAARVTKNLIELPVDIVLLFALMPPVKIAYNHVFVRRKT